MNPMNPGMPLSDHTVRLLAEADDLIDTICQAHGISRDLLCSHTRSIKLSRARAEAAWRLRYELNGTRRQIAHLLNRSLGAVTYMTTYHRIAKAREAEEAARRAKAAPEATPPDAGVRMWRCLGCTRCFPRHHPDERFCPSCRNASAPFRENGATVHTGPGRTAGMGS